MYSLLHCKFIYFWMKNNLIRKPSTIFINSVASISESKEPATHANMIMEPSFSLTPSLSLFFSDMLSSCLR